MLKGNQQQLEDFKGIWKWKLFVPFFYVASWILMIVGPLCFPKGYQIYCFVIIGYSLVKTALICLSLGYAIYRLKKVIKRYKNVKEEESNNNAPIYHAIIIPSYKEDSELLLETLNVLAKHQLARTTYIVMLAMEAHEEGSDKKAEQILKQVKHEFLKVGYTRHQVRQGQAKGKASNVSWCVEHLQQHIQGLLIVEGDIMITVMDADSWGPEEYFRQVNRDLAKRGEQRHHMMFSPPQIFTRNHLETPVFNRTYDCMHSMVHLANIVAISYAFPLSNYTISYNLARRIGYWDTCSDAIGEDFHTCQKCHWKTDDSFTCQAIYVPFNQLSLITGQGYCYDIKARFLQAYRHTRGVADVAYCLNMLFKTKFKFRNLILVVLVSEVFLVAAIVPWALLSLGIMYKLVQDKSIHFFPMVVIDVILNLSGGITIIAFLIYEGFKRTANSKIFKQKNDGLWRIIENPIFSLFALFGYSVPAFVLATFATICTQADYKVAEKKVAHQQEMPLSDKQLKGDSLQEPKTDSNFPNQLAKKSSTASDKPLKS